MIVPDLWLQRNLEEGVRSRAYGQLMKGLLQAKAQARVQQNS